MRLDDGTGFGGTGAVEAGVAAAADAWRLRGAGRGMAGAICGIIAVAGVTAAVVAGNCSPGEGGLGKGHDQAATNSSIRASFDSFSSAHELAKH